MPSERRVCCGPCVNADKFSVYLILLKSLMHGHGRCTRLGTCLVYTPCFVAFVACENADKFSVYVLHFIEVSCARAWTRQAPWYVPCASAACILCRVCSMCLCFDVLVVNVENAGCAWAWTRHVPLYMPSVRRMCCGLCCMRQW